MKDQNKAYIFAGLAIVLWSTVASAFKISLRYVSSLELLTWSSFFSLLVFFLVLVFNGRTGEIFSIKLKHLLHSSLLGFLNPFLYYLILFNAYDRLPAQEAQPLNMTWPIVLVVMSIFMLKQKVKPISLIAFAVSFLGAFVIATHGNILEFRFSDPLGVGLALGSSIVWAWYWIENVKDSREEVNKLFFAFLFGFAFSLITLLSTREFVIPSWQGIVGTMYIGLFEMGLTFIFWMKALKYSHSTDKVSILIYIIPFTSFIFIWLLVGEHILLSSVIGAVLIVAGIVMQKYFDRKRKTMNKSK